jgi:uncharacterized protein (DUF885 family)
MKKRHINPIAGLLVSAAFLSGCAETVTQQESSPAVKPLAEFFADADRESMMRSPMYQNYRGFKNDNDSWDILTEARFAEDYAITERQLNELKNNYDRADISAADQMSYDLFVYEAERDLRGQRYDHMQYLTNQMFGYHSAVVSHLVNIHSIENETEALDYIARLNKLPTFLAQIQDLQLEKKAKGVLAPKFTFDHAAGVIKRVTSGQPLDNSDKDNVLFGDFKAKVDKLDIDQERKQELVELARKALTEQVGPAYKKLSAHLAELGKDAKNQGVWALPDGAEYYAYRLEYNTTTKMTPDEIHELGLKEVARIQNEMRGIMKKVGFEGDLQDFFEYTKSDPKFFYSNDEKGRAEALARNVELIEAAKSKLDQIFITKPKADLIVKAVEEYRAQSAGLAFYQRGTPDGKRPGIYYLNLYNTKDVAKWQMVPLALHEGLPGHHMQGSITQEIEGIPDFRKFGSYTGYSEGWGLYSEFLGVELGFYEDPYDDFGRLALELRRACRLVADTGIHHKRWTREEAIDFWLKNMPVSDASAAKSIERFFVMPGQATSYKIGMIKLMELRQRATEQLGDAMDVREFHDLVLRNGAIPLSMLEELVDDWIAGKKA